MADEEEFFEAPSPTIENLLEQKTLKWIFVGGKGGVGKTTCSCSLAVRLSKVRESVLLVSTDPAHNLSDAFNQKFTKKPTKVHGFDNLSAMEIDPELDQVVDETDPLSQNTGGFSMMQELTQSIPGIDEAMSFAELMKMVGKMEYDVIVFDTAPTGHTLRLLSFPQVMDKALSKIMDLKGQFAGLLNQFGGMFGLRENAADQLISRFEETKQTIDRVDAQFRDSTRTTFVCVCISEFLSLYETERLIQELSKFGIDTHNIIVNQLLQRRPENANCEFCNARLGMQRKYLEQIADLYEEDFHVIKLPLLTKEVRGPDDISTFSQRMLEPESGFE